MEIKRLVAIIWKRIWLFFGIIITISVSTAIFTFTQTPIYETEVRFIVSPSNILLNDIGNLRSAVTSLDTPVVANTYAEISQSPSIVGKAWKQLGISPQTGYEVNSSVLQETTIVTIVVSGPDPELSHQLANAISDQALSYVRGLTTVYDLTLLDPSTLPGRPSKPNNLFNLVLGFTIGIMAAVLTTIMAEYLISPIENAATDRS